ncbi:hypothetical protein G210_0770, partial [Candida maltosa Xu316]
MTITYLKTTPKTPIYHLKPKTPSKETLVLIPGNPGLVDFYITYLDLIHRQFPHFEILCIGHAGFVNDDNTTRIYDLAYQIDHKYDILKQHILTKNESNIVPEFYFLHHSMGSYIYQRAIRKLYQDETISSKFNVKFSGFITPTIYEISQSSSGQLLSTLMNWNVPVVWIALMFRFIVGLLPDSILRKLIYLHLVSSRSPGEGAVDYENSIEGAYKIIKSPTIVRQALSMAQEEMTTIKKEDEENDHYFEKTSGIQNWLFFAQDDHW